VCGRGGVHEESGHSRLCTVLHVLPTGNTPPQRNSHPDRNGSMDTKTEAEASSDSEEEDEGVALAEVHRCQKVVSADGRQGPLGQRAHPVGELPTPLSPWHAGTQARTCPFPRGKSE